MKKLLLFSLFMIIASTNQAQACMQGQARITGKGVGAAVVNRVCMISVKIQKITQHGSCPLRTLSVGKVVDVATTIAAKSCPEDEVTLEGVVSNAGGGFRFSGSVR